MGCAVNVARSLLVAACVVAMTGLAHAQGRGFEPRGYERGPAYAPPRRGPPYRPTQPAYHPDAAPVPPRGPVPASDWREQQDQVRQAVRRGQMAPLGRVIGSIRQITPGRPLDAGIEYRGDRPVYRVRWVSAQGRRVDYIVDAATGAILSGR